MVTSKRRTILAVFLLFFVIYFIRQKISEPYSEIARLEQEVFELKRRNVLRMLHGQAQQSVTENELQQPQEFSNEGSTVQIHLPNIIDIYPHLIDTKELTSLNPALRYPDRDLPKRQLIMGVPTIPRGNVTYLVPTLQQLFQKARIDDLDKIRVIVMMSDVKGTTSTFVQETLQTLKEKFNDEFASGLLQVIVPPPSWYPDLSTLVPTFDDKIERMYWRTKQNLDYAYLMMYAARMGTLYLQLEDDIEAAPDYTGTVFKHAVKPGWFIIELSTLGYIGKLMRSSDIPSLAVHILLNYKYKPIDWLLFDYCTNRYCSPEMGQKNCVKELGKHRLQVKPAMFQHVGYYSSLSGKIQKLKDRSFKRNNDGRPIAERGPSGNPDAKISTTMNCYQRYTIESMYAGSSIAWLIDPQEGDSISVEFTLPKKVSKISIKTGTLDHKDDIFGRETTIRVDKVGDGGGDEIIGLFQDDGSFSYSPTFPIDIDRLEIRVEKPISHWVIIEEMSIFYEREG